MKCPHCCGLQCPENADWGPDGRLECSVTLATLQDSANEGCQECDLLLDALKGFGLAEAGDDEQKPVEINARNGLALEVRHGTTDLMLFRHPACAITSDWPNMIGTFKPASQHSSSLERQDTITQWLKECTSEHNHCQDLDEEKPLPTRILRLSEDGHHVFLEEAPHRSISTHGVHVILEDSSRPHGPYVALSYCWGRPDLHNSLKTTSTTLADHKNGIPVQKLPKTIRDAVEITKGQGLRYLWVDALCIIQDDLVDWAREATSMCDVYSNAMFTIVASRASGSSEGIFGVQSFHEHVELPYKDTIVCAQKSTKRQHDLYGAEELWLDEPINKRAWTVQENILSKGLVVFTAGEIRWRCNTWRKCECGMMSKLLPQDWEWFDLRALRLQDAFASQARDRAYQTWIYIITMYSRRSLTYQSDRLPALAGLARQFSRMMKLYFDKDEQYLAGIWSGAPCSLLWQADESKAHDVNKAPIGEKSAPSWSWVSVNSPVRYALSIQRNELMSLIIILAVDIKPRIAMEDFGAITSASIRVRGQLLECVATRTRSQRGQDRSSVWSLQHGAIEIGRFTPNFDPFDTEGEAVDCAILLVGHSESQDQYGALALRPTIREHKPRRRDTVLKMFRRARREPDTPAYVRVGAAFLGLKTPSDVTEGKWKHVQLPDYKVLELLSTAPEKEIILV